MTSRKQRNIIITTMAFFIISAIIFAAVITPVAIRQVLAQSQTQPVETQIRLKLSCISILVFTWCW